MSAEHTTTPLIHLNGVLVPQEEARVSVLDRGFLFGDGVYELVRVFSGVPLAMEEHVQRLQRSLEATGISGFQASRYHAIVEELLRANRLEDACVYLQVTRGQGPVREHLPTAGTRPTVLAMATPCPGVEALRAPQESRAILHPDERWLRCEIKALTLLPNVMAMISAGREDAEEAILHRDGCITEGTSSNVLVVLDGCLATPPIAPTHSNKVKFTKHVCLVPRVCFLGLVKISPICKSGAILALPAELSHFHNSDHEGIHEDLRA